MSYSLKAATMAQVAVGYAGGICEAWICEGTMSAVIDMIEQFTILLKNNTRQYLHQ
jgi:hypothetical protein